MTGGRLTTHVLDTARGLPAEGMEIRLYRLSQSPDPEPAPGGARREIARLITNKDGRSDRPLLEEAQMLPGCYELVFSAGDWLRRNGLVTEETLFLDEIPIRFGIARADRHLHVPLLISAYGYSTYRGS